MGVALQYHVVGYTKRGRGNKSDALYYLLCSICRYRWRQQSIQTTGRECCEGIVSRGREIESKQRAQSGENEMQGDKAGSEAQQPRKARPFLLVGLVTSEHLRSLGLPPMATLFLLSILGPATASAFCTIFIRNVNLGPRVSAYSSSASSTHLTTTSPQRDKISDGNRKGYHVSASSLNRSNDRPWCAFTNGTAVDANIEVDVSGHTLVRVHIRAWTQKSRRPRSRSNATKQRKRKNSIPLFCFYITTFSCLPFQHGTNKSPSFTVHKTPTPPFAPPAPHLLPLPPPLSGDAVSMV